ncbi:MAG: hypothetical protein NXI08_16365 [bacterium]|nr:hypothetical protein [bacterium]
MKYYILSALLMLGCKVYAEIEITTDVDCACEGKEQKAFSVTATGEAGPFEFLWKGLKDFPGEVDMGKVLKKLPDPSGNPGFYDNLQATLFKSDGTLEVDLNGDFIAKNYFKDIEESGDAFLAKFTHSDRGARAFDSWEVMYGDDLLRKSPDNINDLTTYLDDYADYLGGLDPPQAINLGDIKTEFDNLPQPEKLPWVKFLNYRTFGRNVNNAGGKPAKYGADQVPNRYEDYSNTAGSDFNNLSYDPGIGGTNAKKRQEAMNGIEAERQGLLAGPITRDLDGAVEFFDGDGFPFDVKEPRGNTPTISHFDAQHFANVVVEELRKPKIGGKDRSVILGATYISNSELLEIRNALLNPTLNLTPEEAKRIFEVNINLD